jgi:cwf21 domain
MCLQPNVRAPTCRAQQVEVAVMEFWDELEGAGGLSRQQIDDRVRVRRAQLTVEAEREAAAAASKDDGKGSSRCRFRLLL